MRILVTGHRGYIGVTLTPMLAAAGHEVAGLDSDLFAGCDFGSAPDHDLSSMSLDIRDVQPHHLAGFDAVCHLAAISNDPLGDLNPQCTLDINYRASVHLAQAAKAAGVERFVFSSSCSLYGAAGDAVLDEEAPFNPVTPYGRSKVLAEQGILELAGDDFSPTFLRNSTAFGVSARLRGDLVVNNLVGYAVTTGRVYLKSDGTPWRPLVHIEDISRAFLAAVQAPRQLVHSQAFNVGATTENYRIREVAQIVEEIVPSSAICFADSAGPDLRNYRVSCDKLLDTLPAARPEWTVRRGVEELYQQYTALGLTEEDLTGARFQRIRRIQELMAAGQIDSELRWSREPSLT